MEKGEENGKPIKIPVFTEKMDIDPFQVALNLGFKHAVTNKYDLEFNMNQGVQYIRLVTNDSNVNRWFTCQITLGISYKFL